MWDGLGGFSEFCFVELRISPISIIRYLINSQAHFALCVSVCTLCSLGGSYRRCQCPSLNEEEALLFREVLNTHLEAANHQLLAQMLTRKIGLLPGQQQRGDISNVFRATLAGDPPGMRSWDILISKQHSEDTILAATGLLCGVTADRYGTQRNKQQICSKTRHRPCLCIVPRASL